MPGLDAGVPRDERFGTDDVEVAYHELQPARPLPRPALGLRQLEAAFEALVEERGIDLVGRTELLMPIVAETEAQRQLVERRAVDIDDPAGIDPRLFDREMDELALAGEQVEARRHLIIAVIVADRDAQRSAVVDQRCAACHLPCPRRRKGQVAAQQRQIARRRSELASACVRAASDST